MSDFQYFTKHTGLFRWEVWYRYSDGSSDPNGRGEWRTRPKIRFWRWISAERMAHALAGAYAAGYYVGRTAPSEADVVTDLLVKVGQRR